MKQFQLCTKQLQRLLMAEENKNFTVKITKTAWKMLISHVSFLAQVNIPAANKLINSFENASKSLIVMPERNPWLENDSLPFQKYRKLLFCKHYLLIYQIRERSVYVTSVVDCRQNFKWLL